MQLFVRTDRTHCLELPVGSSVADVLVALEERTGVSQLVLPARLRMGSAYSWWLAARLGW